MKKIIVRYFNSRSLNEEMINSLPFLTKEDFDSLNKISNFEVKQERAVSLYFKRKYVGDFSLNKNKKPVSDSKYFNISHSEGMVIYVESDREIGIDLENLDRKVEEELINHVTSLEENKYIDKDNTKFFEVWTAKEALLKCFGTGLVNNLKEVVSLPIDGYKTYQNEEYTSKHFKMDNFIFNITIKGRCDFDIELKEEKLIRVVKYKSLVKESRDIRETVFVLEQGFKEEFDSVDSTAFHYVLYIDKDAVATGRVYFNEEKKHYALGRFAVRKEFRKLGIGSILIKYIETDLKRNIGDIYLYLSSQKEAISFYEKNGYEKVGDYYLDENHPHIQMVKKL